MRAKVVEKFDLTAEGLIRYVIEIRRLAMLDGQFSTALRAIEMLGKTLANAGFANPFGVEPVKLQRPVDEEMSSNDLAREVSYAFLQPMRRQAQDEEQGVDASEPHINGGADYVRGPMR